MRTVTRLLSTKKVLPRNVVADWSGVISSPLSSVALTAWVTALKALDLTVDEEIDLGATCSQLPHDWNLPFHFRLLC